MIDITERRLAEQIIQQQNAELKKLNSDKDRFISILAHDLRSPFNVLLGFTDVLLRNYSSYDHQKTAEILSLIHKSANQTFNLLNDLLVWVQSQSGKLPFQPDVYRLKNIIDEVLVNMRTLAEAKQISLFVEIDGDALVVADINMLNTILRNLLSNAIKFTRNNGKITVSVEEHRKDLLVSIIDNGIGIDKESQEQLFDITRVHSTEGTNEEKGSGLGLLLCKEFVEKHGGNISVESTKGVGSTFSFNVPKPENNYLHDR